MSRHTALIRWTRDTAPDTGNAYSRVHTWTFDGGTELRASASPQVVPLPWSAADAVDPEEAFVASLASCHMLWFLSLATRAGWQVLHYQDAAEALLGRDAEGRQAITEVWLRPKVSFAASQSITPEQLLALHHQAHEACFLANSVRCRMHIEPV